MAKRMNMKESGNVCRYCGKENCKCGRGMAIVYGILLIILGALLLWSKLSLEMAFAIFLIIKGLKKLLYCC